MGTKRSLISRAQNALLEAVGEERPLWLSLSLIIIGIVLCIFYVPYVGIVFNAIGALMIWAGFVLLAHKTKGENNENKS